MNKDNYGYIIFGLRTKLKALKGELCPVCDMKNRARVVSMLGETKELIKDFLKEEPGWLRT